MQMWWMFFPKIQQLNVNFVTNSHEHLTTQSNFSKGSREILILSECSTTTGDANNISE